MNFNSFDFVILGIVLLSTVISVVRGFLREVISLLTWVVAALLALHFAAPISTRMVTVIASPGLRYFVAFAFVFLGVLALGLLLSHFFQRAVSAVGLGFVDRLLGACFGVARGLILVTLLLLFMTMTSLEQVSWVSQSQLFPKFMPLLTRITHKLPVHLRTVSHAWLAEWILPEDERSSPDPKEAAQRQHTEPTSSSSLSDQETH